jgi:hypothetical protein
METSSRGSAVLRRIPSAYLLAVFAFAATVSVLALRQHLRVPYNDDWRLLDAMYQAPLGEWLFSVQNGQCPPPRLSRCAGPVKGWHRELRPDGLGSP